MTAGTVFLKQRITSGNLRLAVPALDWRLCKPVPPVYQCRRSVLLVSATGQSNQAGQQQNQYSPLHLLTPVFTTPALPRSRWEKLLVYQNQARIPANDLNVTGVLTHRLWRSLRSGQISWSS